jgi:hypothetical protein
MEITQQDGSRGAAHSTREWQQAAHAPASAQPTPDPDRVSPTIFTEIAILDGLPTAGISHFNQTEAVPTRFL